MRSVRRIFRHRSMVAMMILIFLMVIGFLVEKEWIDRVEEERSFEQLYQEAEEMAREIEAHAKADREQLELLATVIAGCSRGRNDSYALWCGGTGKSAPKFYCAAV